VTLDFTAGRYAKSLRRGAVGLDFRHCELL
jgi:hypothetical protein